MSSQGLFCGNSYPVNCVGYILVFITHLHDETHYAMIKHNVKLDISD